MQGKLACTVFLSRDKVHEYPLPEFSEKEIFEVPKSPQTPPAEEIDTSSMDNDVEVEKEAP